LTKAHRRLIEHVRTLYRADDLNGPKQGLLPLKQLQALALPGESYKLAFTSELLPHIYRRKLGTAPEEDLLPNPGSVLRGDGGYVLSDDHKGAGLFSEADPPGLWWIPSGRVFFSPNTDDTPTEEADFAQAHFFLPHRFCDPFHTDQFNTETTVAYDQDLAGQPYDLLVALTRDALGNEIDAVHDYRVLQPRLVTDPNGNRSEVAFDALGLVVGTAVMGKAGEKKGDVLDDFVADLDDVTITAHIDNPLANPHDILQHATSRLVYDLTRFTEKGEPVVVYTLARETHDADLSPGIQTKIQHSFSYSDGFGREIQKKIQAEPGTLEKGGPIVNPRWVGSGWTVFNNKGKPVRQYEPFFSATHGFEFARTVGVSLILFYDPVERVVATLHPNHTWEKVVFDPWRQTTYDVNDTVLNADGSTSPKSDEDVKEFFSRLPDTDYLPTWYEQRITMAANHPERVAAEKTAVHRQTPTVAHLDTLGHTFLTIAHNRFERNNSTIEEKYPTRVALDIEGNQRVVRDALVQNGDALGRIVMHYNRGYAGAVR